MIISAIASLSMFFTLKVLSIFHIDRLSRLIVDRCKSLHFIVGKTIHGDVLTLYVGVGRHVHLVFTLSLLSHELLLAAILVLRPTRL